MAIPLRTSSGVAGTLLRVSGLTGFLACLPVMGQPTLWSSPARFLPSRTPAHVQSHGQMTDKSPKRS
jgi:hypothetical protein